MQKLYLPRSDVNKLPDMAEIIFWDALMSSSPPPGPLSLPGIMRAMAKESSGSNLSWSWPPVAWCMVVIADQVAWSERSELEKEEVPIRSQVLYNVVQGQRVASRVVEEKTDEGKTSFRELFRSSRGRWARWTLPRLPESGRHRPSSPKFLGRR